MSQIFERVILYARQHRATQGVNKNLHRLIDFLQQYHIEACVDEETAPIFNMHLPILSHTEMGRKKDLIIVVGGDGSLLSAARMAVDVNVPVIGINRGRLGFLTDILPADIEQALGAVLNGHYQEEQRFFLQTRIHNDETDFYQGIALNDVVLGRGNETHLIEFDVFVDGQFVSHYRSDGMILATPTGSTAYALSAGGPIMHPMLDAIVLVPMFSHSLSSRPLVVGGGSRIDFIISPDNESSLRISCDGHESRMVKPGQRVSTEKKQQRLRLLHPGDYQYYDTLRIKLGWQSRG